MYVGKLLFQNHRKLTFYNINYEKELIKGRERYSNPVLAFVLLSARFRVHYFERKDKSTHLKTLIGVWFIQDHCYAITN